MKKSERFLLRVILNIRNFKYEIFEKEFIIQLIEINLYVLFNYIKNNPLIFISEKYENLIDEYLFKSISIQLHYIINESNKEKIEMDIKKVIEFIKLLFHSFVIPRRSYKSSFKRIEVNNDKINKKIEFLKNVYQPAQRSEEWYNYRHETLTASNIWKVFKNETTRNQLIYEKCGPRKEFNKPSINSPMHWGQKYEPVSILYYEKIYKTKISDFGLIPHNKYSFLAASPDGINTDKNNYLFGRMLEIKNVVSREISGIPKSEYWIQMQLQMEVCQLNECDFLETKFIEYLSYEEFIEDGEFNFSKDGKYKGIILAFENENEELYFEYKPLDLNEQQYKLWKNEKIRENFHKGDLIKEIYWKLEFVSCILVLRNKFWFDQSLPILSKFWDIIKEEKITGYQHRAPKKRIKEDTKPFCLIDKTLFS
jgi:putative phage-type endonuclease